MATVTNFNGWVESRKELLYLVERFTQAPTKARIHHLIQELGAFYTNHQEGKGMPALTLPKVEHSECEVNRWE